MQRVAAEQVLEVAVVRVAWPSLSSSIDLLHGCGADFKAAKADMSDCLSSAFTKANSSAGLEVSQYSASICDCDAAFKKRTASCADDNKLGELISSFDTYSPAHCACAASTCNALGQKVSHSVAALPGPDMTGRSLKIFAALTFVCWCCCCLGASTFQALVVNKRKRRGSQVDSVDEEFSDAESGSARSGSGGKSGFSLSGEEYEEEEEKTESEEEEEDLEPQPRRPSHERTA